MEVVGVDGWRGGWVAVTLKDGSFASAEVVTHIGDVLKRPGVATVAIDIPIGLPAETVRMADRAAKRLLGARSSSVFFAPPRPVLEVETYRAANALSKDRFGFGLSAQSYALRTKVIEVDDLAPVDRMFEVHPEVTFWMLAGRVLPSKKTWEGVMARRRLLETAGLELPDDLGPAGEVPVDDVLDAAAASLSAARIASGTAVSLPDPPELNAHGHEMAIWY